MITGGRKCGEIITPVSVQGWCRMWVSSLIFPRMFAASWSMLWPLVICCLQTADVCFRCSSGLLPGVLAVWPMQCSSQLLQETTPVVLSGGGPAFWGVPEVILRCWMVVVGVGSLCLPYPCHYTWWHLSKSYLLKKAVGYGSWNN